ncbi:MAG: hypothetical protein ABF248_08850 [Yoonia sp.]
MMCDARVFYAQFATLSAEMPISFMSTTGGERMEEVASQILS